MAFITNTWWLWFFMALLGWGCVFFAKYRAPIYLKDAESFGENIRIYFSLRLLMFCGLLIGVVGIILLFISIFSSI